jgi:hypothetical protein
MARLRTRRPLLQEDHPSPRWASLRERLGPTGLGWHAGCSTAIVAQIQEGSGEWPASLVVVGIVTMRTCSVAPHPRESHSTTIRPIGPLTSPKKGPAKERMFILASAAAGQGSSPALTAPVHTVTILASSARNRHPADSLAVSGQKRCRKSRDRFPSGRSMISGSTRLLEKTVGSSRQRWSAPAVIATSCGSTFALWFVKHRTKTDNAYRLAACSCATAAGGC